MCCDTLPLEQLETALYNHHKADMLIIEWYCTANHTLALAHSLNYQYSIAALIGYALTTLFEH
jgi:hypothetical protein